MLRQRVFTALALLALLLPALFSHAAWPLGWIVLAMIGAGGWEWARLNGLHGAGAWLLGLAVLVAVLAVLAAGGWQAGAWPQTPEIGSGWRAAALLWLAAGALALRLGPQSWPAVPPVLRWLLGMALLAAGAAALLKARSLGLNFLLSSLCLVWAADVAAYFSGRAFGRRKLAPSISPGKSWEGAIGGLLAVLMLALLWVMFEQRTAWVDSPSIFAWLKQRGGLPGLIAGCVLLVGLSIVGDLFESLVKRAGGAKDSSDLLPGHGGVLDRIDALLPVLPAALALASW